MKPQDDFVVQLNTTLKSFIEFFSNNLPIKVLEIDRNSKSTEYYNQLKRLSNSLEQYTNKNISLFYVGFLGSYSSGKSSTINSLLDLWNTDKERASSNNPTDSFITLLTNEKNQNDVFTFSREGALTIRTNANFHLNFLNTIVIMDTPGSGDPNIVESIVRDSLPLCDLIIYTLNATAPFTDIDKPFLEAQQKKLNNIPLFFVLTRGDEFRIDNKKDVSNLNFNQKRYEEELQTTILRINSTIEVSNFQKDNFIIIDNRTNFNIDVLKQRIIDFTLNSEENLIVLHNHKLNYFRKEIEEIHKYYQQLVKEKLEKCENFIDQAKSNIEAFTNQIEISKIKYRNLWNTYSEKFNSTYSGTIESYINNLIKELEKLTYYVLTNEFKSFKNDIIQELRRQSSIKAIESVNSFEESATKLILDYRKNLFDVINYDTFELSEIETKYLERIELDLKFPLVIRKLFEEYSIKFKSHYNSNYASFQGIYGQFTKSLRKHTPIETLNNTVADYRKDIFEIFETYYDSIKMYNIVVFSFEVRNYIGDLGLAKELEKIESNEINKTKYNLDAEKLLVNKFYEQIELFENEITELNKSNEKYGNSIKSLESFDNKKIIWNDDDYISADKMDSTPISSFMRDCFYTLKKKIQDKLFELKTNIINLRKQRTKRYLRNILISVIIVLIVYISVVYLKSIQVPNNLFVATILGIVTSTIATLLTRWFDNFKDNKELLIKDFKNTFYSEISKYIEDYFTDFKKSNIEIRNKLESTYFEHWSEVLSNILDTFENKYAVPNMDFFDQTQNSLELLKDFKTKYSYFNHSVQNFLNNHDQNFQVINTIGTDIKNETIQPSFILLKNTQNEIESVKVEIDNLRNN
jgi:predicted GTPase